MDYDLVECGSSSCIRIATFGASIPDTTVHGITVANARLTLKFVRPEGFAVRRNQEFTIGPGDLEVTMFADVAGFPLVVTAPTTDTAVGSASPNTNALSLRGLTFGFGRLGISASLSLDISATYDARPPLTTIYVLDEPAACSDPVTLLARATDPDGDTMENIWRVDQTTQRGISFEGVLAKGLHYVTLTTIDASGRAASAALEYRRQCK